MESSTNTQNWQLRTAACELLAFSLRYPDIALAQAVATGEWHDAAKEIAASLDFTLPDDFGTMTSVNADIDSQDVDALLPSLRAEATRLFIGAPDAACNPYEGVWRAADDGVEALLFVNPHSMAVERFCRKCGLGQPEGTNEPLDHIATEYELLEYLAGLQAGIIAAPEGAPSIDELPGGSPAAAYDEFMRDHALTWMPRFAERLAGETRLAYYRDVAALLKGFLG